MKTCENCYWADKCPDAGKRCEYYDPIIGVENIVLREYEEAYDPIIGGENIVRREYEEALTERVEEYNDLVREQQDDYYGD